MYMYINDSPKMGGGDHNAPCRLTADHIDITKETHVGYNVLVMSSHYKNVLFQMALLAICYLLTLICQQRNSIKILRFFCNQLSE